MNSIILIDNFKGIQIQHMCLKSDCCWTTNEQYFSYTMARTSYIR